MSFGCEWLDNVTLQSSGSFPCEYVKENSSVIQQAQVKIINALYFTSSKQKSISGMICNVQRKPVQSRT